MGTYAHTNVHHRATGQLLSAPLGARKTKDANELLRTTGWAGHAPRGSTTIASSKYPIPNFILKRANEPLWNLTFNSLSSFGKIA